ncbi:hypothetical protein [Pelagibaculum spongiae]|uniref:Uncharacterized protein n=1 Tax=Pelagibaculum spongiae TaxID=2080658 RepID=A0A2V1GUV6_9GAMM|nr:hypothetical protein [Pelagibaculum spongiae]PVZ68417.1 hypothetical protein DC094_14160 [Pelagibaculum spongiae]
MDALAFFSEILRQYKINQEIELIFLTYGAYGKNLIKKIFQVFLIAKNSLSMQVILEKTINSLLLNHSFQNSPIALISLLSGKAKKKPTDFTMTLALLCT